ncbi:MAG: carboxypeptidase regulatory-like domain-containing protein, partial [Sphingobacteriales bacterium]
MHSTSAIFRLFSALALAFLLLAGNAFAQEADSVKKDVYVLKGKVMDAASGQGIPRSSIRVIQNLTQVGNAITDIDGEFLIESFPNLSGVPIMRVEVLSAGYSKKVYFDLILHPHFVKTLNVALDRSVMTSCRETIQIIKIETEGDRLRRLPTRT